MDPQRESVRGVGLQELVEDGRVETVFPALDKTGFNLEAEVCGWGRGDGGREEGTLEEYFHILLRRILRPGQEHVVVEEEDELLGNRIRVGSHYHPLRVRVFDDCASCAFELQYYPRKVAEGYIAGKADNMALGQPCISPFPEAALYQGIGYHVP